MAFLDPYCRKYQANWSGGMRRTVPCGENFPHHMKTWPFIAGSVCRFAHCALSSRFILPWQHLYLLNEGASLLPVPFLQVFQCGSCRTVIADSLNIVDMNAAKQQITFKACTSTACKDDDIITSKEGDDRGSTYEILRCKECATELGRRWTANDYYIPDLFSFHLSLRC